MEEIYKILDAIMKKNHEIAGYYINKAEDEISGGKRESKLLEKLIATKMEEIKKLYIELENKMREIGLERTEKHYEQFNIPIATETIKKPEENVVVDIREDILDYIKTAYEHMNFLSDPEEDIFSIYDGTSEELIRDIEYQTYRNNLISIENREDFDEYDKIEDLGYVQISQMIEDLADNVMYDKAARRIEKVTRKLENGEYKIEDKSEVNRIRRRLIYMKCGEEYKSANQKANGLLSSSIFRKVIENSIDLGMLNMQIGLTDEEYGKLYESRIYEGLSDTKEEVKIIFKEEKEKRLSKSQNKKSKGIRLPKIIQSKVSEIQNKRHTVQNGEGR